MDGGREEDGRAGGIPSQPNEQQFSSAFYNQLLAAAAAAVDPNNQPEHPFPQWSSYETPDTPQASVSHGLNVGYDDWSSLADTADYQNFAADTFATSGHLPSAANFNERFPYFGSHGQHGITNATETAYNQQLGSDLNADMNFVQASEHGRDLYANAFQQMSPEAAASASAPTSPFAGRTYDPFGTAKVFPTVEALAQAQAQALAQEPTPQDTTPTASQSAKPSYSEVAKQKLSSSEMNSKKDSPASMKEEISVQSQPPSTSNSSAKVKKSKPHVSRSRSVPVEPTTIPPESRYGLDTFDDPLTTKTPLSWSSQSGESSRKGSFSSGFSGEDVLPDRPINVYDIQGPGPGAGSKYHSELGDIVQDSTSKVEPPNVKAPEKKSKSAAKSKPFFDPKRIFNEKAKKPESAAKSFIPNNQQNLHFDEADAVLNNGKAKSNWKTSSAKYINNDLRDSKKQTNTEARNFGGLYAPSYFEDDLSPPSASSASSQGKGRRVDVTSSGAATTKKSSSTMTEDSKPAATALQQQQQQQTPKKVKKEQPDLNHIIGVWVMIAWEWFIWAIKEVGQLTLKLVKLLLSVTLLFLLIVWHYSSTMFCKCWSFVSSKLPFLHRWTGQAGGAREENNSPQTKARMVGLKENITLPTTGHEAMKRLLSCKGKDPYSILGLKMEATDDDIKRYYRRQAVLVHPDKNQQPGAEEAFKILGHAIELIGEADKRRQYDSQRTEAQEAEHAMHEFSDLLTKLHEKMDEASNMMRCDHCSGKHKRVLQPRPAYAARFCGRCNIRHPAKEGDVWAESSVLGFLWHYYACMEGKVYDITEWVSCQHEHFKCLQANSHQVIYRISTGAVNNRHRNNSTRASEEFGDFLSNLFHQQSSAGAGGPGAGDHAGSGKPATASGAAGGGAGGGGGGKKGGQKGVRRRKKKH